MFKKILLAVDLNDVEAGSRSTEAAVEMAKKDGAALLVLNVVPDQGMPIVSAAMTPDHRQSVKNEAEAALSEWANSSLPDGLDTQLHVARGTVYDQIIKEADRLKADCIVVGAHSPALKDYLIGPNAARVARHANQSVFVVR